MMDHAMSLEGGHHRAQCINIANFHLRPGQTIADRLFRDHYDQDGHKRAALLMVEAGCAIEKNGDEHCYGKFTFEDGSIF